MKQVIRLGVLLLMLSGNMVIHVPEARAQNEIRLLKFNLSKDHYALQGYDVVSYFIGEPLKGNEKYELEYLGVIYKFATAENLALFRKQPAKFEPMYGGWCAYAMGESGEKVKIDPETFKIIDGKLYLFYNFYFSNTLIDWNKKERELKQAADLNWQKILHEQ